MNVAGNLWFTHIDWDQFKMLFNTNGGWVCNETPLKYTSASKLLHVHFSLFSLNIGYPFIFNNPQTKPWFSIGSIFWCPQHGDISHSGMGVSTKNRCHRSQHPMVKTTITWISWRHLTKKQKKRSRFSIFIGDFRENHTKTLQTADICRYLVVHPT